MIRSLSAFSFGLSSHNRLYYPYRMRYFLVEHAVKNAFPKFDVAGNKGYEYIVYSRCHICGCNWHPQVVKAVADQRNQHPRNKVPHCLIEWIAMAFKRNITLQRKINALSDKGSCFIADKVAKAAADDDCSGCVIEDVVAKQTPGKIHARK